MLGRVHILMIAMAYTPASRTGRGGGGRGNVTDRKQELLRQLRVVHRNPSLIATLFLLKTGLLQLAFVR
jgi:hypothetical protein